jgi:hypothetical protein
MRVNLVLMQSTAIAQKKSCGITLIRFGVSNSQAGKVHAGRKNSKNDHKGK